MSYYKSLPKKDKERVKNAVFADLLRKNIPINVIPGNKPDICFCPRCKRIFWNFDYVTKYCSSCGQAIKISNLLNHPVKPIVETRGM